MGRPKGSKNKTPRTTSNEVDVPLPLDSSSEDQVVAVARNTDNDTPTQGQLAKAIQGLIDSAPVKRVPFAKFKTHSPFNPTGNKKRKLSRRCYQNGFPMDIRKLHDEEISLLNQLRPGRFIKGLVTVREILNGGNTDLHIYYANQTIDQRMANKQEWRNLGELLKRCLDESTVGIAVSV